mgnify:FL=1
MATVFPQDNVNPNFLEHRQETRVGSVVTYSTTNVATPGTEILHVAGLELNTVYKVISYAPEITSCGVVFLVVICKYLEDNIKRLLIIPNNESCPVFDLLCAMISGNREPKVKFTFIKRRRLLSNDTCLVLGNPSPWTVLAD